LLTRRELLMFVSAAVSVGVITVALLMGRGARSTPAAAAGTAVTPAAGASAAAPARPAVDRAAAVGWSSEHQDQWVGNRRHTAAFEVPADDTVAIWLGRVRPILVVRCADKKTEAFVFTGSAIKIEPRSADHTVTFGFDGGAETTERWPDSAEHDALFAPDGAAFAGRVTQARTLRFGYTPHNAAPVVATFHVNGLGPLMEPVARDCGPDAKKPAH
jgi:hypothetical protein